MINSLTSSSCKVAGKRERKVSSWLVSTPPPSPFFPMLTLFLFYTAERMDDLHYRLRVVDLLEALAKQRTPSPLLVLVVLPLFSIIRRPSTLETELQEKSLKLLRHIVAARKDVPVSPTPQLALDALAELHVISQTVDAAELATLCSQTSVFLVKAALASPAANESTSSAIAEIFGDSFETYLSKKNAKTRVQPALTLEFAKRSPVCAWLLFDRVVDLASGKGVTVNAFRRMQAFEVAHALLTSQAAVVSLGLLLVLLFIEPRSI